VPGCMDECEKCLRCVALPTKPFLLHVKSSLSNYLFTGNAYRTVVLFAELEFIA
jgi:hypothetical protein